MTEKAIEAMILYFEQDRKMINHTLKVLAFAQTIGKLEGLEKKKQTTLELAAVFHDIGIKVSREKYNSTEARYQEKEGPPVARKILEAIGTEKEFIDRTAFIVGNHHSYEKIDDIDFQIVVEADFLVNLDEGFVSMKDLDSIKAKYFKTESSLKILDSMYKQ